MKYKSLVTCLLGYYMTVVCSEHVIIAGQIERTGTLNIVCKPNLTYRPTT